MSIDSKYNDWLLKYKGITLTEYKKVLIGKTIVEKTIVEFKPVAPSILMKELGLNQRGQMQKYFDTMVAKNLQSYVSFKSGTQERSILTSLVAGSGEVHIDVDYAEYQAYSKRIKKRVGKRGTRPFERMVADKRNIMLNELAIECRRVSQ
jgi:hypothetical protein